ncbi:MAG: hypothetical protein QXR42_05660 [Candidatus Bathyarchaeia archaeon]
MRILIAIPLGSSNAPALENLSRLETKHDLTLVFLVTESNDEALDFAEKMKEDQTLTERFEAIKILKCKDHGWIIQNLAEARNSALDFARKNCFDALWFVDSDIRVPPNAMERLLSVEAPIAAGFYTFRGIYTKGLENMIRDGYSFTRLIEKEDFTTTFPKEAKPFETKYAGCFMVKKPALYDERLNFEIEDPKMGEDCNFCVKAWRFGYKVMVDPGVYYEHAETWVALTENEMRKIRATLLTILFLIQDTTPWINIRKIARSNIWFPGGKSSSLMPKSCFEPSENLIVFQTGSFEYTLLFGMNHISEIKDPQKDEGDRLHPL